MIYIQFEAMPTQGSVDREDIAGAFVNCWIRTDDVSEAERIGRQWIGEQRWVVIGVEETRQVNVESEVRGPNAQFIREAIQSGGSLVFHRWPAKGEDPRA